MQITVTFVTIVPTYMFDSVPSIHDFGRSPEPDSGEKKATAPNHKTDPRPKVEATPAQLEIKIDPEKITELNAAWLELYESFMAMTPEQKSDAMDRVLTEIVRISNQYIEHVKGHISTSDFPTIESRLDFLEKEGSGSTLFAGLHKTYAEIRAMLGKTR